MIPDDIRPDSALLHALAVAQEKHDLSLDVQSRIMDPDNLRYYLLNTRYEFPKNFSDDKVFLYTIRAEIDRRLPEIVASVAEILGADVDAKRDALNLDISIRKDLRDFEANPEPTAA